MYDPSLKKFLKTTALFTTQKMKFFIKDFSIFCAAIGAAAHKVGIIFFFPTSALVFPIFAQLERMHNCFLKNS